MSPVIDDNPVTSRRRIRYQAARVVVVALCLAAAIAIWALITGHFDSTEARMLGTTLVAAILTLTGLVGATALDGRGRVRERVGQATIGLSALDFGLAVAAIWSPNPGHIFLKTLAVVSVLLPAFVHASLMLGQVRSSDPAYLRRLARSAILFASTAALMVAVATAFFTGPVNPAFWRTFGVMVVLATLATLLTPILRRLTAARTRPDHDARPASRAKDDRGTGPAIRFSVPPPGAAGVG